MGRFSLRPPHIGWLLTFGVALLLFVMAWAVRPCLQGPIEHSAWHLGELRHR